ncbi:mitomycin resistance protein [Shewanella sp. JM162201]|uniref:Mitomycin resistance protein n=1 Tax=Shewanella jiangmenensis TaxID=2837387 RepID=A0ABS5V0Q9_9GAMM|nr:helix-hairpin-helix domain-containing protein [Shewanella jiangmenensis]MBT1444059.1 mitomycin resistance protein [Shewanella jiangmenensis]
MHPDKVDRSKLNKLTDLPNVGPATAKDLLLLGINSVDDLAGQDPLQLYWRLCDLTFERQDPCVLDVLMSLVAFSQGAEPRPWWDYTAQRKARYGDI